MPSLVPQRRVLFRLGAAGLVFALASAIPLIASAQTSSSPIITTAAGTGLGGFAGDGGSAINARLTFPTGVAEDGAGDLFIADSLNYRVREVSSLGTITTLAGNGIPGFSGDGGPATKAQLLLPQSPAVDGNGNVFIADSGNNRIREVTPNGVITTFAGTGKCGKKGDNGPAIGAQLCYPTAVAIGPGGSIFVADTGNNVIRRITPSGNNIVAFAGSGKDGSKGDGGAAVDGELRSPDGIAVSSLGQVFIADSGNNKIREVKSDGTIITFAGTGRSGSSGDGNKAVNAQLSHPEGVGVDPLGNVYIADTYNFRVRVVIPNGDIFTYAGTGVPGYSGDGGIATSARISLVVGDLAADANNLYLTDTVNQRVRRVQGGPPPNIPESSRAILLPLTALALLAAGAVVLRHRKLLVTAHL